MTMINSLQELRAASPEAADYTTTMAAGIIQQVEDEQKNLPAEQKLTGQQKKELVVSRLEQNIMAFGHAVNLATGNNPLVTAGINLAGPVLEEATQSAFDVVSKTWAFVVDLFDGDE